MDDYISRELGKVARGRANRGRPSRVFDWDEAARRIRERGAKFAVAGLEGDWHHTAGQILEGGEALTENAYAYLSSNWATPCLELDEGAPEPCWKYEGDTPGWSDATWWPDSALAILRS